MNLEAWVAEFLDSRTLAERSPDTIAWYRYVLGQFAAWVAAQPACKWWEVAHVRAFLASLQSRPTHRRGGRIADGPPARSTRAAFRRGLATFFRWLRRNNYIAGNPFDLIETVSKDRSLPKAMTQDTFDRLLSACQTARDRAVLLLLRDSAARVGELCSLLIQDVDLTARTALCRGKTGERPITFSPATAAALRLLLPLSCDLRPETCNLFRSQHGGPLTVSGVEQLLRRLAKRAGVAGRVNPHSLRHAYGRDFLRSGGDIGKLQHVLGHSSIAVTQIYTGFNGPEIRAINDQWGPLRGNKKSD